MKRRLWSLSYLCCVLLLVIMPACSSDDDNPTNPGGTNTGDPVTDTIIAKGIEMGNALVGIIPQWAGGNLVGPSTKDAVFNPNCQCWIWEVVQGDGFSNPYDYTIWNFRATFYDFEGIVPNPQDAVRVGVSVSYSWNKGTYPEESKRDDESTSFNANLELIIDPLGSDPVEVNGMGDATFVSVGSRNGNFFEYYGNFELFLDMSLPLVGCPSGFLSIQEDETIFQLSFDGTSTANWALTRGAETILAQGSRAVPCGNN